MAVLRLKDMTYRSSQPAPSMSTASSYPPSTLSPPVHTNSTSSPGPASQTQISIGIGIGISAVTCILIIAWLFLLWRRRKQTDSSRRPQEESGNICDCFENTPTSSRQPHVERPTAAFTSVPLRHLQVKDGKVVPRQGSETVTSANTHEACAAPSTRNDARQWRGHGGSAEIPTISNEGRRGRPEQRIQRRNEVHCEMCSARQNDQEPCRGDDVEDYDRARSVGVVRRSREDDRYTFLID